MGAVLVLWNDEEEAEARLRPLGGIPAAPNAWVIPANRVNDFKRSWQAGAEPSDLTILNITGVSEVRQTMMDEEDTSPGVLKRSFPNAADWKFTGSP